MPAVSRDDMACAQVEDFTDILPRIGARKPVEKFSGVNFQTTTQNRSLQELELLREEVQQLRLQTRQLLAEREQINDNINLQNAESQREIARNRVEMKKLELREQEIKAKKKEDERRAEWRTKALENEKQRIENNRIRDFLNLKKDADNSKAIGLGFATSGLVGVGGALGAAVVAGATVAAAPIVIGAVGSGSAVYGFKKYVDGRSRDKEIADAYSNKRKESEGATGEEKWSSNTKRSEEQSDALLNLITNDEEVERLSS